MATPEKLSYYGYMLSALTRSASTKRMKVKYLGNDMHYDNFATPLTLQLYPHEINNSILKNVSSKPRRVLDIGGNIGQFSLTLAHALKDKVKIDIVEPNSEIYGLLKRNVSHKKNIKTFNAGIGNPQIKHLFYAPGRSGTGSVFKSNTESIRSNKKLAINMVNDIKALTGCEEYDLTKIDVEGYEYSLLEAIRPFKTKYLFLEASLNRYKNFQHSQLFSMIENKFGKFDILHLSGANSRTNNFDVLFKFL